MRALVIASCCTATALLFPAASRTAAERPSLQLVQDTPLVVRGAHFRAAERVTVTLFVHGSFRKAVTARSTGAFVASFPAVRIPSCTSYSVTAAGSRGSRASVRVIAECPQDDPEPLMPLDPIPGKKPPG